MKTKITILLSILSIAFFSCEKDDDKDADDVKEQLREIDLESILIQSNDLPYGFYGGDVKDIPSKFDELPEYDNAVYQEIYYNNDRIGQVVVFLYVESEDIDTAYQMLTYENDTNISLGTITGKTQSLHDIGEKAELYIVEGKFQWMVFEYMKVQFTRCYAVSEIYLEISNSNDIVNYARKLDDRLTEVVCAKGS